MKGFKVNIWVVMALILAIIVLTFHLNFLFSGRVEMGTVSAIEEVECRDNSDCNMKPTGPYCLSINNEPTFCGCLSSDPDCGGGTCIYNRCQ